MTEGEFCLDNCVRDYRDKIVATGELMTDIPPPAPAERLSPLHELHVAAGASFTDFAGWQMPVSYGSDLAEHHAVRTAAGLFDISHMAEIRVRGADAASFLDYALAGKLSAVSVAQAKYSLLLNKVGGIIDDLVVYRQGETQFYIVANAGNRAPVVAALRERATAFGDVEITDQSDELALIAVQGPNARAILEVTKELVISAEPLETLKYYWSTTASFAGEFVFIGRTGYTGEDGFELYIEVAHAADLWTALLAAGEPHGLIPAGLASRDTLRLEAGMPLYGHELDLDTFPVQAGLGRVVNLKKEGDFVGRAAIESGPPAGARILVGLKADGKRAGRAGYEIYDGDSSVGVITSGALSPTLGYPIAMAYVEPGLAEPGTELSLDVRGTRVPASVVPLPFYTRSTD
jgi:aminomethyltransferase